MLKYQLFPDLDDASYAALKDSIREKGVLVPIDYDENGEVLDGHHRIRACAELGITAWHRIIRRNMTEEEKKNHVRTLNLVRRQLTKEQRARFWADMRRDGMTLAAIAAADGTTSIKTVQRTLDSVLSNDKTLSSTMITGKDGKLYPVRRTRPVYISERNAQRALRLPDAQREAVLRGETRPQEAAREAKLIEIAKTVTLPNAKYRVLLADPPWAYGNTQPDYQTEQRDHYPVMSLDEICALPVKDICLDDAVLFLWVTSPILEEAFQVVHSWGFQYKTSFVWDKVKHNLGHYNSIRHEFLLVCTRGSCQPDTRKLFDSVVTEERTEHSKKPAVFYKIIDTIYPIGKRIELFARGKRKGWDTHGFEA